MADEHATLFEQAEALLGEAAVPERDWDALARAVEERVATTTIGSTPEALLAAPFEAGAEDGPAPESSPVTRLTDLARSVAQKRASSDVSGLALESLSVAAQLRAQGDTLLERVRSAPLRPPVAPPPAPSTPLAASPPPSATAEAAPVGAARVDGPASASAEPATPLARASSGDAKRRRSLGLFLAAAAVAVGGVALFVGTRQSTAPEDRAPIEVARPASEAPAHPNAADREREPASPPATPQVAAEQQHARALPSEDPAPVASAEATSGETPKAIEPAPEGPTPVVAARRAQATTPRTQSTPSARVAAKPREATPTTPEATPPSEASAPALRPAAGTTHGLPEKPSTGAVQAAVGSVLGSARACVAGSKSGSNATIVFAPNGSVSSVTVTGPAANTPAEACLRSALSRARVEPFAATSFSVNVSVRP